jgi:hypothetical protein
MIRHRSPRVRMRKPTVTQKEEEAPEGDNTSLGNVPRKGKET